MARRSRVHGYPHTARGSLFRAPGPCERPCLHSMSGMPASRAPLVSASRETFAGSDTNSSRSMPARTSRLDSITVREERQALARELASGRGIATPPAKEPPKSSASCSSGTRSLVGATGFEPATHRPPVCCATRLRHAPSSDRDGYSSHVTIVWGDCHDSCSELGPLAAARALGNGHLRSRSSLIRQGCSHNLGFLDSLVRDGHLRSRRESNIGADLSKEVRAT